MGAICDPEDRRCRRVGAGMTIDLESVLSPIDWRKARARFPLAASRLVWALDADPATTLAARNASKSLDKFFSAFDQVIVAWDAVPEFARREIEVKLLAEATDHGFEVVEMRELMVKFIDSVVLTAFPVYDRMLTRGERDGRATRMEIECKIADALAYLYALSTGQYPTCYPEGNAVGGEYGKILERLLHESGFCVGDLSNLTEPVRAEITETFLAELRAEEANYSAQLRTRGRSLFDRSQMD